MVQTWQSERRPNETCPECGSVYEVTVTRYPHRDKDSFECVVCNHKINEWNRDCSIILGRFCGPLNVS